MTSKRLWRMGVYKKSYLNSLKTFYTPSLEDRFNHKQKIKNFTNNKIQEYFSKGLGIYATTRYILFSNYLNRWQNKINNKLSRGLHWYKSIVSKKQYFENDNVTSINNVKFNKFSYISKISGFYLNINNQFLIKSLMSKNIRIFKNNLLNIFMISTKRKILKKGLFKIKLISNLRKQMMGSGYISLKQEVLSLDFVSNKLKNFYKLNTFYYYKNVNSEKFGYFYTKQKRYNFIEISYKKNIKFKNQVNSYLKKNKWLINSYEVRESTLLNSGKNI